MNVYVFGSDGFVGQNLLKDTGWIGVSRQQLDLLDGPAVDEFFRTHTVDIVIHCAVIGGSRLQNDTGEVTYKNILMFENVARQSFKKLLYFSSGAALRGNPPTDPYGLSKWIIDKRIETLPSVYSLRIWGCYGPGELPTRFSAVCRDRGHVVIQKDRYFDFIDIMDVKRIVKDYVDGGEIKKFYNLVYDKKMKLSEWAVFFGATYEIVEGGLDKDYIGL